MYLKIPDLECCFAYQLFCAASPNLSAMPLRRRDGRQPGGETWGSMADLLLQFSYEFCLCSVWVLVYHVYQKSLRIGELDPRFIPFHSAFAPFCWQLVVPLGMQHWPTGQPSSSPPPASVGWLNLNPGEMALVGMNQTELIIMYLYWFEPVDAKRALDSRLETAWNSNYLRLLPTCRFSFSSYWYCVSSRNSKYSFPHTYAVYSDLSLSIDLYE